MSETSKSDQNNAKFEDNLAGDGRNQLSGNLSISISSYYKTTNYTAETKANSIPQTRKILILAANPKATQPLRLDEEMREIDAGLQRAKKREQFDIKQYWAVRVRDVTRALLDENPQIVHFSGHGSGEDGLVLENETGQAQFVNAEALAGLFGLFADRIECVVLNACYSKVQAEAIFKHIPYVIGMNKAIGDKAAIAFAVGFYDALGAGESIEFAYQVGCSNIQMAGIAEHLIPILLENKLKKNAIVIGVHNENYNYSNQTLSPEEEFGELLKLIDNEPTGKLSELAKIAGLNLAEDYIGADFSGEDLSNDDLSGANLSDANLSNSNLSQTNLSNANLSGADLSGADLSGADLSGTSLDKAEVSKARFRKNLGISKQIRKDLIKRGATFEDLPNDRSTANTIRRNCWIYVRLILAKLFGIRINLNNANLNNANLNNANLNNANLNNANLNNANLNNANLSGASLTRANLSGANLIRANLSGANLIGADLSGVRLSYANLIGADLSGVRLSYANLIGADLSGVRLSYANLIGANLIGANLIGANLIGANLRGANLIRASLSGANLWGADLIGANLSNAHLEGSNLWGADLSGANLSNASLIGADLSGADLIGANLSNAHLEGSNLWDANLSNAHLEGANLWGANLWGANLSSANLIRANLIRASLSDANLSNAHLEGANLWGANLKETRVKNAQFAYNEGISKQMRQDLIKRGAIFEDSPGDRSPFPTPH